jgi:hypothetical protein
MYRRNYHHHTACEHTTPVYANPFTMCGENPGSRFRLPCQNPTNVIFEFSGHCRDCMAALVRKLENMRIRQEAGWEWAPKRRFA